MKKLFAAIAAVALAAAMAVSMAACADNGEKIKIIEIDLTQESYAFALPKVNGDSERQAMVDTINGIIDQLTSENGYGEEGITVDKLFLAEADGTAGHLDSDDFILYSNMPTDAASRDNYFVVATNAEFAPLEYTLGAGQYFAGVDMQIAKIIADELDKQLVIADMAFDSVIPSVAGIKIGDFESKADADIGMAGLSITPDREENVTFSKVYATASQRVAVMESDTLFDDCETKDDVRAAISSLNGEKAAAARGQTGLTYLEGSESMDDPDFVGFPNLEGNILSLETIGLAVQELQNGNVRIVVGDRYTLQVAVDNLNG